VKLQKMRNTFTTNTLRFFPHSWYMTGCVTGTTWRVPLVEKELPTLPEHLGSPHIFSGVRVARSLVFCVLICRCFLSSCPFSIGYCSVYSSAMYDL
jgi:hypothetical protein